mmetsp:Transcript_21447/g.57660  ORF Transcript_21447/g.57660 Transcript_21447/m.57660 type:complete len:142 (+) Transcript_21447:102-527(+)
MPHTARKATSANDEHRAAFLGRPVYTLKEVEQHNTDDDLWMTAHGRVYDVSALLVSGAHPGGNNALLKHAGGDVTRDFDFHSAKAQRAFAKYQVGWLEGHTNSLLGIAMWAFTRRSVSPETTRTAAPRRQHATPHALAAGP